MSTRSEHMAPGGLRWKRQAALLLGLAGAVGASANTVVAFQTSLGTFEVSLYDSAAPATVANFMNYVNSGRLDNSLVHRSVPDFLIQGGGYYPDFSTVPAFAPVVNEANLSNVRGTLAMGRLAALDSATSYWYINTVNNAVPLDEQGYTVIGVVLGDGMQVVDAIAALPIYDYSVFGTNLRSVPLRNFTGTPAHPARAGELHHRQHLGGARAGHCDDAGLGPAAAGAAQGRAAVPHGAVHNSQIA